MTTTYAIVHKGACIPHRQVRCRRGRGCIQLHLKLWRFSFSNSFVFKATALDMQIRPLEQAFCMWSSLCPGLQCQRIMSAWMPPTFSLSKLAAAVWKLALVTVSEIIKAGVHSLWKFNLTSLMLRHLLESQYLPTSNRCCQDL